MMIQQATILPLSIGGINIRGEAGSHTVTAPFSGRPMVEVTLATAAQAEAAIAVAAAAFADFRHTPVHIRASLLQAASDRLAQQREPFARLLAEEVGKPIRAARTEVDRAIWTLKLSAEEARRLTGEVIAVDATPAGTGKRGLTMQEPIGVVTCIVPFNYPLNLLAHKVGPALAAGNTVVIKPSPKAPQTTARLVDLLIEVGFPTGTVNHITCDTDVAELLVTHYDVAAVSFTGSAAVGRSIRAIAGLKPVVLELGSNAGNIVAPSADLDHAAQSLAAGGFSYAGQSCISVQRIYVHRCVMNDFAERLVARVKQMHVGDPMDETTDVGPMIDEAGAARVETWVQEAADGGAQVLIGGTRTGQLMQPTVLVGVDSSMRVVCEEVFGPVISLLPYDHFDEAIQAVNQSRYGLHAGVFTNDLTEVTHAMKELSVGGVVINDASTFRADVMPYGGVRESGLGREGIRFALADLTHLKAIYLPW